MLNYKDMLNPDVKRSKILGYTITWPSRSTVLIVCLVFLPVLFQLMPSCGKQASNEVTLRYVLQPATYVIEVDGVKHTVKVSEEAVK